LSRPSSKSDLEQVSSSTGIALPGRLIGRLLQVATTIFLARELGPDAFGLFAVAWSLIRVAGIVAPLGFDQAVLRFGTPHVREPAKLRGVLIPSLGIATALGAGLGLVLFVTAPWVAADGFGSEELSPLLRCVAIACPFVPLLRVAASATRLSGSVRYSILSEDLGQPFLMFVTILALAPMGLTALGSTIVASASFAAAALLAVAFLSALGMRGTKPVRTSPSELLAFALPTAATSICWALIHVVDRLAIGLLRSPDEVGLYQAASQPAIGFSLIASAVNVGFAAIVPRLAHAGQFAELERVYRVTTRWAVFMCVPPLVVIAALPSEVMKLVFGVGYADTTLPLLLLAAAHVINAANGQTSYLLVLAGHQRTWLKIVAALFALDVVLIVVLVTWLGAPGGALATLVTMVLMLGVGSIITRQRMKMTVFSGAWLKGLVAGGFAWVAVELLVRFSPLDGLVRIVAASIVSLVVFAVSMRVLGVDADDIDMLRSMLGRRRRSG
jgi:O-antigen/teichoic acid export membrane protein